MSKKATPRKSNAKQQAQIIRQRAAAIIANLDDYNNDTRDAIYNALEGVPGELAELVKRAGAGDIILDCRGSVHPPVETNELKDFAHHLSEAIRIARENPIIPASLYNSLADALFGFENDLPSLSRVSESEAHIMLTIESYIEQTAEQTAKGGKH